MKEYPTGVHPEDRKQKAINLIPRGYLARIALVSIIAFGAATVYRCHFDEPIQQSRPGTNPALNYGEGEELNLPALNPNPNPADKNIRTFPVLPTVPGKQF